MKTRNTFLLFAFIAFLASCSVEKRHYMSGYYFNGGGKSKPINIQSLDNNPIVLEEMQEGNIVTETNEKSDLLIENNLVDLEGVSASIDNPVPLIISTKTSVISEKINFERKREKTESQKITVKELEKQEAFPKNKTNGGKSQIIALILCLFLGGLGIHRFYLGHVGMGILYLLTGGLCGIGWLIDLILIATGGLKPKDGEYSEKF